MKGAARAISIARFGTTGASPPIVAVAEIAAAALAFQLRRRTPRVGNG